MASRPVQWFSLPLTEMEAQSESTVQPDENNQIGIPGHLASDPRT